eukprot:gnl/MRDRNA2_/MRDRNA2_19663_c0_seq1.p1 gnl/MRDRNA2_/MRDRNA2_19663_c0~~gnl/MRDRNA2_/MRDRNA2_19663_c0_seq1.p1  ORF type:complete len:587 (-),score=89.08 gnl/MRDRNA2_/MRDRNA2_19663_c0_seq1:7-1767(-)
MQSFYKILNVESSVTKEELRVAFRHRALEVHPDKGGTKAAFQQVLAAFEALVDPAARAKHDLDLQNSTLGRKSIQKRHRCDGLFSQCKRARHLVTQTPTPFSRHRASSKAVAAPVPKLFEPNKHWRWPSVNTPRLFEPKMRCQQKDPLQQIYLLLQQLPPERRRMVLKHSFSEVQRQALEKWMLEHRARGGTIRPYLGKEHSMSKMQLEALTPDRRLKRQAVAHPQHADGHRRHSDPSEILSLSCEDDQVNAITSPIKIKEGIQKCKQTSNRCQAKIRGITTEIKHGQPRYGAVVTWGMLVFLTRRVKSLKLAIDFLLVLTDIKQHLMNAVTRGGIDADCLGLSLRKAIQTVQQDHGLDSDRDLDLHFVVCVPTRRWIGTNLQTPGFRSIDIEQGLRTWRRLQDARGQIRPGRHNYHACSPEKLQATWSQVRNAYLGSLDEMGCTKDVAIARLDALEMKHRPRQEREVEWWNRSAMAREERNQRTVLRVYLRRKQREERKVASAQVAIERTERNINICLSRWDRVQKRHMKSLAGAKRSQELSLSKVRQAQKKDQVRLLKIRREARWKWMNSRDLTMEEILGRRNA